MFSFKKSEKTNIRSKGVELGAEVRDTVTGFQGIAVAKHEYLAGCLRFTVQPKVGYDGKVPEAVTFDEPLLEVIEEEVVPQLAQDRGGPEKYTPTTKPIG